MSYKTWENLTDEEKGALLLACHKGKTIEVFRCQPEKWEPVRIPSWHFKCKYRVKPEKQYFWGNVKMNDEYLGTRVGGYLHLTEGNALSVKPDGYKTVKLMMVEDDEE